MGLDPANHRPLHPPRLRRPSHQFLPPNRRQQWYRRRKSALLLHAPALRARLLVCRRRRLLRLLSRAHLEMESLPHDLHRAVDQLRIRQPHRRRAGEWRS